MATDHFQDFRYMGKTPWWNFNVLFDNQTAIHQMAKDYAPALHHPGLYAPIPPEWLHATIVAVGEVADFSEQEMARVVEILQPKLAKLELPRFSFDSWWIWDGCVVLHITPDDQFSKIYDCVIESLEAVVGSSRTRRSPDGKFLPHMTLAYTKEHKGELEINRQLKNHPVRPVEFTDISLSLIKQRPIGGHYEWSLVKELAIGKNKSQNKK